MMQNSHQKYPYIFQSGYIGPYKTKNRVKYAACCVSNFNRRDGFITEREIARDRVIADTGCGIITNQGAYPDPRGEGKVYYSQIALYDDKFLPQFERIAQMIHDNGAVAIQQILHGGRYGGIDIGYCVQPSVVPQTLPHFRPPREMTKQEIIQTIKEHGEAAERAIKAGFDGVEITSFMGYLLANFLSKFTNKRTDEYGGSVKNRARFMIEVINEIKEKIGSQPLVIRLNGTELMDEFGGNTEEECLELVGIAAETGGVDMISLVIGWQESRTSSIGRDVPPGHWNYLAERAKKIAKGIPLAFGVRLPEAAMANAAIAAGQFDFWEVCRPFLADPRMLHKYAGGREEEIKPCIGCLLCLSRMFRNLPYLCTVNPVLGHEVEPEYSLNPAAVKKNIYIIGAGPAGIECALAAAQRGHNVTLIEKEGRMGGQLRLWATRDLAYKEDLFKLLKYYQTMLDKCEIKLELNTEVNDGNKFRKKYGDADVVVLATGAAINLEGLPVTPGANVLNAYAVMEGQVEIGKEVIIIGGGKVGLCTAEYLAQSGKKVTIVEEGLRIAEDVMASNKWRHIAWIQELGVETITKVKIKEIQKRGVIILKQDGEEVLLEADNVVCSTRISRQELLGSFEFAADELYFIGDAAAPRGLYQAIHEGYRLGVRL